MNGLKTSKTDPASWTTFDDAIEAFNAGRIDGIGFCIAKKNDDHPADDPFVIIDLDNCITSETEKPNDWASYLLELFSDCYAEISPSGHGIKIFVRGKLGSGRQSDDSKGIELLGPGSYVCVTGRLCAGSDSVISEAQDRIDYLQKDVVQEKSRTFATATMTDREIAISCLDALAGWRCDEYTSWIRVGQILHSIDHSLLSEWDSWSRGSDKYQEGVCAAKWQTFTSAGNGLRIGTLVHWAKEDGWVPPKQEQNQHGKDNGDTNSDKHSSANGEANRTSEAKAKDDATRYAELLGDVLSNGEMIAKAKPPNFLVRNFVTSGTLSIWAAPEKAWKTTLAHHLALVAAGHGKFLGIYENYTHVPTIYFSGESGNWPLKSMQERILQWVYPGEILDFHGQPVSVIPEPSTIPITWGGDPPDLGNPDTIPALKALIATINAKLLILDPSQAMFGSISEEVKNDFAMRQYLKKLQLLARETLCAIVLLHHFRQHVSAGFPKRSDSSYGAFTKFCDTWILMNQREEPTGDEEPGSGKLWITWGSRDGFGASHAIDIAEGTHEAGRYFDLQVTDVGVALDDLAERKAARKGQESKAVRKATIEKRKEEIRAKLAGRDTAVTVVTLAGMMGAGRETIRPTVKAMLDAGELKDAPAEYHNHGKLCWNPGFALPETAGTIIGLATKRGWKGGKNGTGATVPTGAEKEPPAPVGTEGQRHPCRTPYTGESGTGGVDPHPGVIETAIEGGTRSKRELDG